MAFPPAPADVTDYIRKIMAIYRDQDFADDRPREFLYFDIGILCGRVETLDTEVARLKEFIASSGIIELAVANTRGSISDYMRHWEGRALKAEAALAALEPKP